MTRPTDLNSPEQSASAAKIRPPVVPVTSGQIRFPKPEQTGKNGTRCLEPDERSRLKILARVPGSTGTRASSEKAWTASNRFEPDFIQCHWCNCADSPQKHFYRQLWRSCVVLLHLLHLRKFPLKQIAPFWWKLTLSRRKLIRVLIRTLSVHNKVTS